MTAMSLDESARLARRTKTRLWLVALVGVALTAVASLALFGPRTQVTPPVGRTVEPPTSGPYLSTSTLVLPVPTGMLNGIPVGYPHSAEGAIAAASYFIEAFDSLEPGPAISWAHTVAVPGQGEAMAAEAAQGVAAIRASGGLATTGSTFGSSISYRPRAYRLGAAAPDRVVVWLLTELSGSFDGGAPVVKPAVVGFELAWTGYDWRMSYNSPVPVPAAAIPGSADAREKGWRNLVEQS